MKPIRLTAALNLQAASGKPRRFRILAYSGGLLPVDGFPMPVVVDLTGLETPGAIPILIDHQPSVETTLGVTDDIQNDGRQLILTGPVTGTSATSKQVLAQAAAGHTWQASIGARVIEEQEIPAGQTVRVNGQMFSGPVIVARRSVLKETSVLPMGADSTTSVNLAARAAALKGSTNMSFTEWLDSLGIAEAALTPEGRLLLQEQFDLAQTAAESGGQMPAASAQAAAVLNLRAASSAELRRQAEIQAKCFGFPHIAAAAIDGGWSILEAENHILRAKASRMAPSNRTISAGPSGGLTKAHLSAAVLLRAGGENIAVRSYGADVCQQARDLRCTSLIDLAAHALTLSGQDPKAHQNNDQMLKAAFSTSSLPNILSDSTGKALVSAYEETTSGWRKFCHVADAADFKEQKGIRPAAVSSLEEVGAGGEIKHGSLGEEDVYEWSVATFARMLSVTRQTIVNDDLNFLAELSPMLGVAAGRSLLDLIWSTILGGQTAGFFASGNSNLGEASSALAVGTLGAGVSAMRSQRDSQGYDLNISPACLVVPPALELTARNLLSSAEQLGTSGPSGNPVKGIVPALEVEPRIANSTRFTGTSSTQWYLFGGPQTRPVIVGFLKGQQNPTVETADADFNTLGIQMRCYFDYGVALGDQRAAYKATGQS